MHDDFDKDEILLQSLPNGDTFYYINGRDLEMILSHSGGAKIRFGKITLSPDEFDDFRKIVLFQNIYEYDDTVLSDAIRNVITKYYELKNRGIHHPTLEDKAMAIIANTSYTLDALSKVPFRSFDKMFIDCIRKIDYIATKNLEPHLNKDKGIDHWIYYPEKEKYSEVFSDPNKLANKISSI